MARCGHRALRKDQLRAQNKKEAVRLDDFFFLERVTKLDSLPVSVAAGRCGNLILETVKKLEKLFIAPKARQILHETAHCAFARCACAQHTGFLIKFLIKNQYQTSD